MWYQLTYILGLIFIAVEAYSIYLRFIKNSSLEDEDKVFNTTVLKVLIISGVIGTLINIIGAIGTDLFGGSFYDWFEHIDEDGEPYSSHNGFKNAIFITIIATILFVYRGNKLIDLIKGVL